MSELKAALIGAVAGMAAAAVGAAAAIIVGVVTVNSTSEATDKQIAAQCAISRSDFLRPQRQTAYASLIADCQKLLFAEAGLTNQLISKQPEDGGAALREVADGIVKLQLDVANVDLIGSPGASDVARQILAAHQDVNSEGVKAYGTVATSHNALEVTNPSIRRIDTDMAAGNSLIQQFISAARADLGSEPPKPR